MQMNQDSWVQTLNQMKRVSREARKAGDEINMIYSKSLFRNRDHLKRQLAYNRLINFDLDKDEYLIIDGTDKGSVYQPQKGDFLLNNDTIKRLFNHGLNMSQHQKIHGYDLDVSNRKIYRRLE